MTVVLIAVGVAIGIVVSWFLFGVLRMRSKPGQPTGGRLIFGAPRKRR
jgi:uncharacterized membrane protein YciS (DUF1049 family)